MSKDQLGDGKHLVYTVTGKGTQVRVFDGTKKTWGMDSVQEGLQATIQKTMPFMEHLGFSIAEAPSRILERCTEAMVAEALIAQPDKQGFTTGSLYTQVCKMHSVDEVQAKRVIQGVISRLHHAKPKWLRATGKQGRSILFTMDDVDLAVVTKGIVESNKKVKASD